MTIGYDDPIARPTPVGGLPTTIASGEVVALNADGTVDVKSSSSRRTWSAAPVVHGLTLAAGQLVAVTQLDGDQQRPLVLARLT